ncbi:acyl-CoA dehydrogenase family protein [Frankia sp. QA3]|uniref:acyl-CoA dehydrogenase family protein n=1 Tax=Frankia sp. QA3 TaxID=710111 RepID=UPI000269BF8E|nr:acyl-CoA dehydrogenase family protein [Frankia sp. QA3]EIV92879.1 acyl-CoA dehydrogenase [Frankia sp. QA3]
MSVATRRVLLLDEEQDEFRSSVKAFARPFTETYLPLAHSDQFPWEENRALGRQGLLGLGVSERFGGQGATGGVDRVSVGVAVEELAYANFYLSMLVFPSVMNGRLLEAHLAPELAEHWLPRLVRGELTASFALTEPAAGSDVANLATRARRVAGGWRISGEKTSITSAPHASAFITMAVTDPERGAGGITAFFVPRDSHGLSFQTFQDAGWRPLGRGAIGYQDVFVPDNQVLGPVGGAFRTVMRGFDFGRALIGLTVVGAARRALDMTVEHVRERYAFGGPIAGQQGVSFPVAEHATRLEAATWLSYRALALGDADLPHTKEAAMVKWWAPEVAIDTVRDCVVLNGHGAFTEELPFQALLRDVSAFQLADGTAQIQKTVIARQLIGRRYTG